MKPINRDKEPKGNKMFRDTRKVTKMANAMMNDRDPWEEGHTPVCRQFLNDMFYLSRDRGQPNTRVQAAKNVITYYRLLAVTEVK